METPPAHHDERSGPRPAWSGPRLRKLDGRDGVTVGVGGEFDGMASSTGFPTGS